MNFDFDPALISNRLVVIDSSIEGYHSLLQGMVPGTQVSLLDASRDGIEQISEILARYSNSSIESLHIISHGSSGNLQLGTTQLNLETLNQYQDQFSGWAGVLTNEADILIYGCDVASGDRGSAFIQQFSQLTGADIAASTDLTGSSSLGGDWDLEAEVGSIETAIASEGQDFQGVLSSLVVANQANNNISLYDTNGSGGFGTAIPLSVGGNNPSTLVVGDINGDGLNDLLTTNEGSSSIGLLLNNGAGGFNAAQAFSTGGAPVELALGDVNNDGRLDAIALINASNRFAVLLNNGTGGFNAQQSFTSGSSPSGIAAIDVNNDGNLDIITSNVGNNTVTVNLGNGTGTFAAVGSSFTIGTRPLDMTVTDLNNDGRLDFITANASGRNVSIGLGNGTGGFTVTSVAVGGAPNAVAAGDLNKDGFIDIATSNGSSNNVSILLGNGNGTFRTPTTLTVGANPVDVLIKDINADGNLDLLTSNANANTISIYTGNGTGGFTAQTPLANSVVPAGLAFADFNRGGTTPGDTIAPVVQSATVNGNTLILTYNETLDGASDPVVGAYTVMVNGVQRTVNSVDANGTTVTLTLASAVTSGQAVTLNYAIPGTNPIQDMAGNDAIALTNQAVTNTTAPPADTTAPLLQSAVVNGSTLTLTYNEALDGVSDPATGAYTVSVNGVQRTVSGVDANGTTVILTLASAVAAGETVTLSYAVPGTNPVQDAAGNDAIALTGIAITNNTLPPADTTAPILQSATVNGSTLVLTYGETLDGVSDPAAGAYIVSVNGVQRTVNSVDANGSTVTLTLANAVTAGQSVTLSYAVPSTNPVQDLAGNDAAVLSNQVVTNTTPPTSTGSSVPTLIVANQGSNSIALYPTNGSGGFSAPNTLTVAGTGPSTVVLGDINGDGLQDVLTTDEGSSSISLFINNGLGGFLAPRSFSTGAAAVELALADVNNDGRLDVVAARNATNSFAVLLNNGNGGFNAVQNFSTGSGPVGIGTADVNGDGNIDVFTANLNAATVSVSFGTGTGSFGTPTTTFAIGSLPFDMAVGDLNGDGRVDFVTANNSGRNVSVGLGNGTGGFTVTNYAVGGRPNAIALGDVNGDGALDIAASNSNAGSVSILLNNRNGGFGTATAFNVGNIPSDVLLSDINNDGRLDLLTSNTSTNQIAVLLGNGTGGFTAQTPISTTVTPAGLAFGSFGSGGTTPPGDATAPVLQNAVINGSTLTLTYNETLDGVSDPAAGAYTVTVNGVQRTVNSVDANGTTVTLTLSSAVTAGEAVVLNYAVPGTNPIQDLAGNDAIALTGRSVTNNTLPPADTTPPVLQSAVVNGSTLTLTYNEALDGASDPAAGTYTITVNGVQRTVNSVNANGTTVTLTLASAVTAGQTVALSYAVPGTNPVQDLAGNDAVALTGQSVTNTTAPVATGSGETLVVTNRQSNTISLYALNSDGTFGSPTTLTVGGMQPFSVTTGDINRDGLTDILTADRGSASISLFLNNGTGGFLAPQNFTVGSQPVHIVLADVNSDGYLDVFTANMNSNNISMLLGNASGGFNPVVNYSAGTSPWELALQDLNKDGFLDLINANAGSGDVTVRLGNGTGSFGTASTYTVGTRPESLVVGDLNNDGNLDFVTANASSRNVSVYFGNGTGSFGAAANYAGGGSGPSPAVLGDVNRDGFLDIVEGNTNENTVSVLLNLGNGTFGAPTNFITGAQPYDLILKDLNGDGNLDLLSANAGANNISVLFGNGAGNFTAQTALITEVFPTDLAFGTFSTAPPADTTPPTLQSAVVNGSTLVLTYSEALDGASDPAVGAYTITVNGVQRAVSSADTNGTTVTLTLASAVAAGETVALNYVIPGTNPVQDAAGNDAAALSAQAVTNNTPATDTTAPVLQTATINGSTLTLTYNETLDGASDPAGSVYSVSVNGVQRTVNSVNANGTTVTLTLASAVAAGDVVTLNYAVPGTNPVQDLAGNDAAALSGRAVTNNTTPTGGTDTTAPTLVNAVVTGRLLTSGIKLIYNERLDGTADPNPNNYTVLVNGVARTVTAVDVQPGMGAEGTTVLLTLASQVLQGDVVNVSYTPGSVAVQDLAGNDAAGFSNYAVDNLRNFTLTYDFMRVSDPFDFTRFGYTYDYGYQNNFNTLPSGATQTTGLQVRKNAADMTSAEIDDYINAILTLKETTVLTTNGVEISLYDQFVAAHVATNDAIGRLAPDGSTMRNPAHGGPAFVVWHRLLLAEYENALQAVNPNVTLPFWDWTNLNSTMNIVLQDNFMGPAAQGEITSGYFSLANGWAMRTDLSDGRWVGVNSNPVALRRGVGFLVQNPGTWETNVVDVLNQDFYTLFANNVERGTGTHNNAHGFIGGIMSNVAASPNDPMFWMLHSNVDRLWAEWQLDNHWGTSFYATGSQNYGHNLTNPLFLWDNGTVPIAADLRDIIPRFPGANPGQVINGNTTINGSVTNTGLVAPGNSPGIVTVQGNYTQATTGKLTIEIAGTNRGQEYDFLKVDGTASLDGTLNLYFPGTFDPSHQKFEFLVADNIQGDFSEVNIFGLETPLKYRLYKSADNTSYNIEFLGVSDTATTNYGVAQTADSLYSDTDLSLYNPFFGQGLDMYIYGVGQHHGWGYDGEDAVIDHTSHTESTNWYLPYNVNINYWVDAFNRGETIPEELLSPMHDDMDGGHAGHEGHHGSECDGSSHCDCHQEQSCGSETGHDHHGGEHSHDHSDHGTGHAGSDADHGDHDHGTCSDDHDSHDHHGGEHSHDHSDHGTGHAGSDADHGDHDHGTCGDDHDSHDHHGGEHSHDHSDHSTGHVGSDADHGDHNHGTCDDHSSHDDQAHTHGDTDHDHPEGNIIGHGDHGSHSDAEEDSPYCQCGQGNDCGKPKQPVTNHDHHGGEHSDDHSNHGAGAPGEFAIASLHHKGNHTTHFPSHNGSVDQPSLHKPIYAAPEQAVQIIMPSYPYNNELHAETNPDRQTKKGSQSSKPKKLNGKAAASDQGGNHRHTGFHLTDQDNKRYSTISMMDCNQ